MFYVKLDVTESAPARLIAAVGADYLEWGHVFVPPDADSEHTHEALVMKAIQNAMPDKTWSIVHQGSLDANHGETGSTVRWVWWLNEHYVGNILVTTQPVYILNENGRTLDRV